MPIYCKLALAAVVSENWSITNEMVFRDDLLPFSRPSPVGDSEVLIGRVMVLLQFAGRIRLAADSPVNCVASRYFSLGASVQVFI